MLQWMNILYQIIIWNNIWNNVYNLIVELTNIGYIKNKNIVPYMIKYKKININK